MHSSTLRKVLRFRVTGDQDNMIERHFPFCKFESKLSDPNDKNSYYFIHILYVFLLKDWFSRRHRRSIVITKAALMSLAKEAVVVIWHSLEFSDTELEQIAELNSDVSSSFRERVHRSIQTNICYRNGSNVSFKRRGLVTQEEQEPIRAKKRKCASPNIPSDPLQSLPSTQPSTPITPNTQAFVQFITACQSNPNLMNLL